MRKRILSILSVQHQLLHLYEITSAMTFKKVIEIGEDVVPLDERFLMNNANDSSFTALKQLLLKEIYELHRNKNQIIKFFQNAQFYRSLKMYRHQMIDDDYFLIRWTTLETMKFERPAPPNAHAAIGPAIFTFFNWKKGCFDGIYGLSSLPLLEIFENANERFRYGFLSKVPRSLTMDLVPEFKRNHETFKKNFRSKNGSDSELCRKILNQLPISMPSAVAFSPFLDPKYFNYDEKVINVVERGRVPPEYIIKYVYIVLYIYSKKSF